VPFAGDANRQIASSFRSKQLSNNIHAFSPVKIFRDCINNVQESCKCKGQDMQANSHATPIFKHWKHISRLEDVGPILFLSNSSQIRYTVARPTTFSRTSIISEQLSVIITESTQNRGLMTMVESVTSKVQFYSPRTIRYTGSA